MGKENRDSLWKEEIVEQILKKAESTPVPLSVSPEMMMKRLPDKKPRSLYRRLSPYALAAVTCIALVITGNAAVKEYLSGRSIQPISSSEYIRVDNSEESREESEWNASSSASSAFSSSEDSSVSSEESSHTESSAKAPESSSSSESGEENTGKKHPPENPIIHDPDGNSFASSFPGPALGEPPSEENTSEENTSEESGSETASEENSKPVSEPSREENDWEPSGTTSSDSNEEPDIEENSGSESGDAGKEESESVSSKPQDGEESSETVSNPSNTISESAGILKNEILSSPLGKFMSMAHQVGVFVAVASPYQGVFDALTQNVGEEAVTIFTEEPFSEEKEPVFFSGGYGLTVIEGETGPALRVYDLAESSTGVLGEYPVTVQLSAAEETVSLSLRDVFYENGILAVVTEVETLSGNVYTAASFYQFSNALPVYQNTLFQSGKYLAGRVYASQLYLVTDYFPLSGYTLENPDSFMPSYGAGGVSSRLSANDVDLSESGVGGYRVLGAMPMGTSPYYVDIVALAGGGKGLYLADRGIYLFGASEEKGVPRTVISKYTIDKGAFFFAGETAVYGSMLYHTASAGENLGSLFLLTQSGDGTLVFTQFDPSLGYVAEISTIVESTVRVAMFRQGTVYYLSGGQVHTLSFTGESESLSSDVVLGEKDAIPFVEGYELELVSDETGLSLAITSLAEGTLYSSLLIPAEEGVGAYTGLQFDPATNLIFFTAQKTTGEGVTETFCYLYRYTGGFEPVAKIPCGALYEWGTISGDRLYLVNENNITAIQISTGTVLWNDSF